MHAQKVFVRNNFNNLATLLIHKHIKNCHAKTKMIPIQTKPFSPKCFIATLFLSITLFLIFLSQQITFTTTTTTSDVLPGLKIRPGYTSYNTYIKKQLKKTLDPNLREIWKTRDWDRKINVFMLFFDDLKREKLLKNESKALSIGARVGQEVEALKRVGVSNSIGIDLVPSPPLVIKGDFHHQPFDDETFDFEFSNVFDHALYPEKFVGEIERTLRVGGVCVLHVAVSRRSDKYSANDLYSIEPLKKLFKRSELVRIRKVDGFGLDTEIIFRKKR